MSSHKENVGINLRCWIVQKNCVEFEKRILVFFFMKSLMEFAFDSRLINIIWSIVLFEENIFIFHTLKLHMLKNVKESDQDKISKNTQMLVFFWKQFPALFSNSTAFWPEFNLKFRFTCSSRHFPFWFAFAFDIFCFLACSIAVSIKMKHN